MVVPSAAVTTSWKVLLPTLSVNAPEVWPLLTSVPEMRNVAELSTRVGVKLMVVTLLLTDVV